MATDKAAEKVRATTSKCYSTTDATQVEATCTELTATKWGHLSTDRFGEHKPHNAEGKAISNVADSSVGQIAAPQLNGKIVHMSVVKDQAARTEEVWIDQDSALLKRELISHSLMHATISSIPSNFWSTFCQKYRSRTCCSPRGSVRRGRTASSTRRYFNRGCSLHRQISSQLR